MTDCKHLADQGQQLATNIRSLGGIKAHRQLWAALLNFEQDGYVFQYHWIERCTIALNVYCDDRAGRCRRAILAVDAARAVGAVGPPVTEDGKVVTVDTLNPD